MSSTPFECVQCWKEERITEVINREAVSVDRATFMATHAPFRHITYLKSPHHISNTSEEKLLKELISCTSNNQHTFVVIQGIPGTGKSHLIRWLKERYDAEMRAGQSELVLLIERAQNSLIGTLNQIINSCIFDDERLHNHQAKLKGATETLSEKALADNILDQLRVATYEVTLDEAERPKKTIAKRIERFLLDPMVRDQLKRPGGPVDRLVRFLATGNTSRIGDDELPGFQPTDFEFEAETTLRNIRKEGYLEARELADTLNQKEDIRKNLADYLNRLLNYAIGRTTALSVEDLKQMFNDVRRYLRQKGMNLALFIEDITAFTGIDSALVDVLATQHTGEGNREFCRLLSVIGITDSYFQGRFPDNIKERIGYHLSLNSSSQQAIQQTESDFLDNQNATADLVARYLNAMRVSQAELHEWMNGGGRPEELPNPCTMCEHKKRCHTVFGAIMLTEEGDPEFMQAGLYPFNAQAIWTMYQRIDTTTTSRTPRSLLNSVLLYVMQSHAHTIESGSFPPSSKEMGSEFTAPTLRKPLQQTIIESQGREHAKRIESLIVFWGDGTVDRTVDGSERLVGGLPETIFKAFRIPFIQGDTIVSEPITVPHPSSPGTGISEPKAGEQSPVTQTTSGGVEPKAQISKYADDISKWQQGNKLENYEDIRKFLFKFLSSAIDWEAHYISRAHSKDRFESGYIEIEGQSGKARGDCLYFHRTPELALVFHALADLNDNSRYLDKATIGGHLANLSTWLYREEPRIVAFVRQPHSTVIQHMPLTDILMYDCLLLEWLTGNLRVSHSSPQDLLASIIDSAIKEYTELQWKNLREQAQKTHSPTWGKLLTRMNAESINECRRNLLQVLNCPQGGSSTVLFIDAALLLDMLKQFKQQNWVVPSVGFDREVKVQRVWEDALKVYRSFESYLDTVIQDELQYVQEQVRTLQGYMGVHSPQQTLQAIDTLLETFQKHQRSYRFPTTSPAGERTLVNTLNYVQALFDDRPREETMLRLSGLADRMKTVQDFITYFTEFVKEFQEHQKRLDQKLLHLRQEDAKIEPQRQDVEKAYEQIIQNLGNIVSVKLDKEDEEDEEEAE